MEHRFIRVGRPGAFAVAGVALCLAAACGTAPVRAEADRRPVARPTLPPTSRWSKPEFSEGKSVGSVPGARSSAAGEPVAEGFEVSGAELCFVSAARLADSAPVAVGASHAQPIRIFDADTGTVLKEFELADGAVDVVSLDIDEAGERVALLDGNYRVWLWDWRGAEPPKPVGDLPLYEPSTNRALALESIRFGPRSERLVVGQPHSGAFLLNRDGLIVRRLGTGLDLSGVAPPADLPGFVVDVSQASWSEDGGRVLLLVDGRPRLLEAETGDEIILPSATAAPLVQYLTLSPDGEWIATCDAQQQLTLTRVATGEVLFRRTFFAEDQRQRAKLLGLSFSADGEQLGLWLSGRPRITMVDSTTGETLAYSLRNSSNKAQSPCRLEPTPGGGFVATQLPCGLVHRFTWEPGTSVVLHEIDLLATPPDRGFGERSFMAGENGYQLVESKSHTARWSRPIQDW